MIEKYLKYNHLTGAIIWIDRPRHSHVKLGSEAGYINPEGYRSIHTQNKLYPAHRLAWYLYYGIWPKKNLDHINHNRLDNRIANLREVDASENNKNIKLDGRCKSGIYGVRFESNKWRANIWNKGKKVHLGMFSSFEEAVKARKQAEIEYNYHLNHGSK